MKYFKPLISIVIPVFNREDLIKDCIESCLKQTYTNLEIIVMDNCSNDSSFSIANNFANKYSNIFVYRQHENVGPVLNWLDALKKAKGDYLKILFSDDILYPSFIEETYDKFQSDTGFVISSFDMGESPTKTILQNDWYGIDGKISSEKYINNAVRKFAFCVSPGAALFRTKDVLDVFETEIPSPSLSNFKSHGAGPDLLIFLRIAAMYDNIYKINKALTFFRSHKNSQTIKMNKEKNGLINSCYMQSRVYFSETYNKKLFAKSLGKAFFVELFQNKNIKIINIKHLVNLYTFKREFSYFYFFIGLFNAIQDAIVEIFRRFYLFVGRN